MPRNETPEERKRRRKKEADKRRQAELASGIIRRPRGAPRQDHTWDERLGRWVDNRLEIPEGLRACRDADETMAFWNSPEGIAYRRERQSQLQPSAPLRLCSVDDEKQCVLLQQMQLSRADVLLALSRKQLLAHSLVRLQVSRTAHLYVPAQIMQAHDNGMLEVNVMQQAQRVSWRCNAKYVSNRHLTEDELKQAQLLLRHMPFEAIVTELSRKLAHRVESNEA